jgi:hypothetical protein
MNSFSYVAPKSYSHRLTHPPVSLSSPVMALTWCIPLDGPITGLALWAGGSMTGPTLYRIFENSLYAKKRSIWGYTIDFNYTIEASRLSMV